MSNGIRRQTGTLRIDRLFTVGPADVTEGGVVEMGEGVFGGAKDVVATSGRWSGTFEGGESRMGDNLRGVNKGGGRSSAVGGTEHTREAGDAVSSVHAAVERRSRPSRRVNRRGSSHFLQCQ